MEMLHKKFQRTFNFYTLTKTNYVALTCEDLKAQKSSFRNKGKIIDLHTKNKAFVQIKCIRTFGKLKSDIFSFL